MTKKLLFVFHEARLTGASLALLRIVRWLKENSDHTMSFLLLGGGVLKQELAELGEVIEWKKNNSPTNKTLKTKIKSILGVSSAQRQIIQKIEESKYDVIYFNTILCSEIIGKLSQINSRKIWHIHELELAINSLGKNHLKAKGLVDAVVANSFSTQEYLISQGVKSNLIKVFYPIVDLEQIIESASEESKVDQLIGNDNSFIVGSSGTVMERKGVQTFIIVARIIETTYPNNNFKYVWVGKYDEAEKILVDYDIKKSGLEGKVLFLGEYMNPYPFYNKFDVFISTSKEESFGLSLVEAACLKKPVLCFENTGGVAEIMSESKSGLVSYLDVNQMAEKIIELSKNSDQAIQQGMNAYNQVLRFDKKEVMSGFVDFISE